jgi:acetyltransferase-like isoleucine patch superfamily enzyme
VGAHVVVNTGAIIDHDCRIAEFAHLAPGSCLAGNVRVGAGCLVGVGSSVGPGVRLGEWSTLGAGGVAMSDIPANTVAVGVPAKPCRSKPETLSR